MDIYNLFKRVERKLRGGVVRLMPANTARGRVLLSYITDPFLVRNVTSSHTNQWECREIARIFLDRGYAVDVVDWSNNTFVPSKEYTYAIDIGPNLERFARHLNKDCIKIFHITGTHWLFNNAAEEARLRDLKERRGINVQAQRAVPPNRAIEVADVVTMLGNDFTESTYRYAGKKIYRIPLSTTHEFPSPAPKDFETARKNFVWIGGAGMVHKGLDIVLEAFAGMPEYSLFVFGNRGSREGEGDFEDVYRKELYETHNIKTFGKVDLGGRTFQELTATSVALVHPSCSEGQSGAVISAMHAGLIPIVSAYSGVDVEPFGITLKNNSVREIQSAVRSIADSRTEDLGRRSVQAWEYARAHHTHGSFTAAYNAFVDTLEARR